MQGDLSNGYNEVLQEGVIVNIKDSGKLDDTLAFSHALLLPEAYVGMGNGTSLITACRLLLVDSDGRDRIEIIRLSTYL